MSMQQRCSITHASETSLGAALHQHLAPFKSKAFACCQDSGCSLLNAACHDGLQVYLGSDKNGRTALAACLAYERSRGAKSPFYPYLRLLPKKPPSLWLKTPADVKSILSSAGEAAQAS